MSEIQHVVNSSCTLESVHNPQKEDVEIGDIYDFYLLRCPYAKSDRSSASSSQSINLADCNWAGSKLGDLMQWICQHFTDNDGGLQLCFRVSDNVNETLAKLGLNDDNVCLSCSRAVLQIGSKVTISENDECRVRLKESYATCFFRHIRNSFAHGNYYIGANGRILLLDTSSKPNTSKGNMKFTFGMVTTLDFLRNLISVVNNGPDQLTQHETECPVMKQSYRVKLNKEIKIEAPEETDEIKQD